MNVSPAPTATEFFSLLTSIPMSESAHGAAAAESLGLAEPDGDSLPDGLADGETLALPEGTGVAEGDVEALAEPEPPLRPRNIQSRAITARIAAITRILRSQ